MVIEEINFIDGDSETKKLKLLSGICRFIVLSMPAGFGRIPTKRLYFLYLNMQHSLRRNIEFV